MVLIKFSETTFLLDYPAEITLIPLDYPRNSINHFPLDYPTKIKYILLMKNHVIFFNLINLNVINKNFGQSRVNNFIQ